MQVKLWIDKQFENVEIRVCNYEKSKEVVKLVKDISNFVNNKITGTDERGEKVLLQTKEIIRFYAENQKVMAQDKHTVYAVSCKLYELEETLDEMEFFRISKSEIINLRQIRSLDLNLVGTIKVILSDGTETYTSRRNVTLLKKKLGIGGGKC